VRARSLLLASTLLVAPALLAAPAARADEKDACVAAHSSGQVSRNEGKLRAARAKFLTCANERCPPLVRRDCSQWHQEITEAEPTVVFEVHDAHDVEVTDVKIRVDGEPLVDRITGVAHEIDPGEHALRFELATGEVIEEKIVARAGEKNRHVVVRAPGPAAPAVVTGPPTASGRAADSSQPEHSSQRSRGRGLPTLAYVFGGVTVVGLGVFTGFSLVGLSKESDLRSSCAPFCAQSEIDAARRDYLVGDIGLGVAIVAAAATVYVLLTDRP
jgi:hypothetical protein